MALYRAEVKPISRSKGHNAVACRRVEQPARPQPLDPAPIDPDIAPCGGGVGYICVHSVLAPCGLAAASYDRVVFGGSTS